MIWRFFKAFYYKLFCTHPINKSEKCYRADRKYGYIDITVYIRRTCEKCGHSDMLVVSEHDGLPCQMEKVRKELEEKGYRNVEDL